MYFPPPTPTAVVVGSAVSLGFATATLLLRLVSRIRIVGVIGAEDAFLVAALTFSTCHVTGVIQQVRYGLGTGIEDVEPTRLMRFLQALFFSILSYVTGQTLVKISILCLYARVFRTTRMYKVYLGMIAFVAVYGLWLILSGIFGCVPVQAFWDITLPANCLPREPLWYANAAGNIFTDFAVFLSPFLVLKTSSLPRRQKIGLHVVFLLGFFVCLISLIRLYYLVYGAKSTDITRDLSGVSLWSVVELNVAIVCASLMVMKPLVAHLFPRLFLERPNTTESYPFNYVIPPTISDRPAQARPRDDGWVTDSPPPSRADCSAMDLSTGDVRSRRASAERAPEIPREAC